MLKNKLVFNNLFFIIIISVLLVGGTATGYYLFTENQKINNIKIAKQNELNDIQRRLKLIPDLDLMRSELMAEDEKLSSYIPNKEGQADFVRELEKLASQNGVQIRSCQSKNEVVSHGPLPQYLIYQWELSLESSYDSLNNFLKSLSGSTRFLMVSDLTMDSVFVEENSEYLVKARLTLDLITRQTPEKVNQ